MLHLYIFGLLPKTLLTITADDDRLKQVPYFKQSILTMLTAISLYTSERTIYYFTASRLQQFITGQETTLFIQLLTDTLVAY